MSFNLDAASVSYPNGQRALGRIALSASSGERIAVIGPSGAGKTSMLRLLATSLRPAEGRVEILGQNPWALSAARLRHLRCRIGMVHQAPPIKSFVFSERRPPTCGIVSCSRGRRRSLSFKSPTTFV